MTTGYNAIQGHASATTFLVKMNHFKTIVDYLYRHIILD